MQSEQPNPNRVLTFTEHLEEFRVRIIIVLVCFVIFFVAGFFLAHNVLGWMIAPLTHVKQPIHGEVLTLRLRPDGLLALDSPALASPASKDPQAVSQVLSKLSTNQLAIEVTSGTRVLLGARSSSQLSFLSPVEPFFLLIKGGLFISCIFTIPLAFYQLWLFVAPGLTRKERRAAKPILLSSFLLFPIGALFAYFVSHVALQVLIGFSDNIPGLQPNIVASEYFSFMLKLMLVFGVVFEFPLVLVLLSRMGIINSAFLVQRRRYAILIIAVLAAIFTPPDPFSMIVTILPMIILFEISIWAIRALERADAKAEAQIEADTDTDTDTEDSV